MPYTFTKLSNVPPDGGELPTAETFSITLSETRTSASVERPLVIPTQDVSWPEPLIRGMVESALIVPPTPGGPVSPAAMTFVTTPLEERKAAQGAPTFTQTSAEDPLMTAQNPTWPPSLGLGIWPNAT